MVRHELYGQAYGEVQVREIPEDYKVKINEWLDLKPEDRVLEIGCAGGSLLPFLRKYSPKTVGMDINQSVIEKAKVSRTVVGDLIDPPFKANSFDKSLSLHVLEHIKDLKSAFKQLDRISKKGALSLHAFPAEVIRGAGAYNEALILTGNPLKAILLARKLHVHRLNSKRISKLIEGTNWQLVKSEKVYVSVEQGPAWMILLQK